MRLLNGAPSPVLASAPSPHGRGPGHPGAEAGEAGPGRRRRSRPCSTASTRASGIDAELVLPVRSITEAIRSVGRPSRRGDGVHDPEVGLMGHEQGDVVDGDLGPLERQPGGLDRDPDGPAEHLLAAHGHARAVIGVEQRHQRSRPPRGPSRAGSPRPGTASMTTAPAPSPKRKALVRSAQLVARVRVSAPIRSTRSMPSGDEPGRGDQAVGEAGAGGVEVHGPAADAEGGRGGRRCSPG